MPWEKEFDMDDALENAMHVFWVKGYQATSISDLTKAMNINKGSLYNAFGSKKALFTKAFLKYNHEARQNIFMKLEALDNPLDSITLLFEGFVAESIADNEKKGCFLVNTALELPNYDTDVREMVTFALKAFEDFFERRVAVGQECGVISNKVPSRDLACSLLSQVVGMRVLARGAFDQEGLNAIKNQAVASVMP